MKKKTTREDRVELRRRERAKANLRASLQQKYEGKK